MTKYLTDNWHINPTLNIQSLRCLGYGLHPRQFRSFPFLLLLQFAREFQKITDNHTGDTSTSKEDDESDRFLCKGNGVGVNDSISSAVRLNLRRSRTVKPWNDSSSLPSLSSMIAAVWRTTVQSNHISDACQLDIWSIPHYVIDLWPFWPLLHMTVYSICGWIQSYPIKSKVLQRFEIYIQGHILY